MFHGRYGGDQLNRALMFLALGIIVVNMFVPNANYVSNILSITSTGLFVVMMVRMFSRNFEARSRENAVFMKFWSKVAGWFQNRSSRAKVVNHTPTFQERRKFKYFYCTQCAQRLRVPRGKGKIRVTCTRCGNKFEMKS